ncbi:MAG TPA: helix-turn-helix transcriptional regulator [Flavobacterium sp.]|jgi:hypothetical protein
MIRINEVLKTRPQYTVDKLAEELGLSKTAYYYNVKHPKIEWLQKVAEVLDVPVVELIEAGEDFQHFYDNSNGEYLGIRKK